MFRLVRLNEVQYAETEEQRNKLLSVGFVDEALPEPEKEPEKQKPGKPEKQKLGKAGGASEGGA